MVRKNTGFGTGTAESFHASTVSLEEQEHWGRGNIREPVQAGWYTTDLFRYYWFTVRITPKASVEDRRRYTAFNYSCFWKYRGCRDARELLPTADRFPADVEQASFRRGSAERIRATSPQLALHSREISRRQNVLIKGSPSLWLVERVPIAKCSMERAQPISGDANIAGRPNCGHVVHRQGVT